MIAPVLASAETVMIDGINYVLNADKKTAAVYAKNDKYSGDIIIPDQVKYNGEDYIVNFISEAAFADCNLTSLTIGKNVTAIDPLAFVRITVPSLIIGNSISSIPIMAFLSCNITTLTIGKSVTKINYDAFKYSKIENIIVENGNTIFDSRSNCNAIIETESNTLFRGFKNSTIPNDVINIGSYAFYYCDDLTSISIPNSVTSIGSCAFEGCSSLKSIEIPRSVTSIGTDAFYDCNNLTSVHITDIGAWCNISFPNYNRNVVNGGNIYLNHDQWYSNPLYKAHHLYLNGEEVKDLIIPDNATIIGDGAFIGCSSITSLSIPNSVTSIGIKSFFGCTNITSVNIPESVKTIGDMAFSGCNLTSLTIGNGVTSIGYKAFVDCSGLTRLSIPNSMKSISSYAFSGCSGLTSIVIPNSVTTIGEKAFEKCIGLTSLIIDGVSSFSADVFDGCVNLKTATINSTAAMSLLTNVKSLEKLTLGDDITKIDFSYIAGYNSLKSITIGRTVSEIGERVFANLDNLTDFICLSNDIPNTNRTAFENSYIDYVTLYVPSISIDKYKTTAPWSGFKEIVAIDETEPQEKCSTPTIDYRNGKLVFESETDGSECVTTITSADVDTHYGNEVAISYTYNISTYAKADGYANSDVVTAMLIWIEKDDATTALNEKIEAKAILVQAHDGTIRISSAEPGTVIEVYNVAGIKIASVNSQHGTTQIATTLNTGDVSIVKIGKRTVKVVMR